MYNKQTSAFIRIPFTVAGEVPALLLRVRYDDGSIAVVSTGMRSGSMALNIDRSGYPKKSQFAWTHPVVVA